MKNFEDFRKFIRIEFIVWFFVLCIVVTGVRIHRHHKAKELVTYQLFLPDVDGIIVGSPVKFMGVQIGYVDKIKIISNSVYLRIVISDKDIVLPKGAIATVEFNGMGGSKSLEVYPPTPESLASQKLIAIQSPKRLHDSLGLLNEMFDKIDSITSRASYFADEVGLEDINKRIELNGIRDNMNTFDNIINNRGGNDEKRQNN